VEGSNVGIEATMLLCDAAESVGGKLYILGGGWSQVYTPNTPMNMALAVKLSVPWDMSNEQVMFLASLVTEDENPIDLGVGPVKAEGDFEIGRPPGLKRGTPLDASFVLNFPGVALQPGGYVWKLEIDGEVKARTPFRVLSQG
jgi:hypothetical protein